MNTTVSEAPDRTRRTGLSGVVARRPIAAFVTLVLGLGLPLFAVAAVTGLPAGPFQLLICYLGLTGGALVLTRLADGPGSVRALLGRLLRWRFGARHWLIVLAAMPMATVAVAAVSGTLRRPPHGWAYEVGIYLFLVLIFGGLVLNLWEELGWTGFLQARLMDRHGLIVGSLLTALPFAALHLPLPYVDGQRGATAIVSVLALFAAAPFLRVLLGMVFRDTGGSLLAVGLLHAAFNASGALGIVTGGWQYLPALALVTIAVALLRRRRPQVHGADEVAAGGYAPAPDRRA
jgi:membrane protease YdiL (CAAX protease family)